MSNDKKIIVVESNPNSAYESSVSVKVLDTEYSKEFLNLAFEEIMNLLGYHGLAERLLSDDGFVKELYDRGYTDPKMEKVVVNELGCAGPIRMVPNNRAFLSRFTPGTKISNSDIESLASGDMILVQEINHEKLEKLSPSSYEEYKKAKNRIDRKNKLKIKRNKLKADSKRKREIEKAKNLLLKAGLLPSGTRDNY